MSLQELAESLLSEEESPSLDFKRDQYKFKLATDEEKAELLKDILAFANAWRRSDAYIFIGVEEVKGGRSIVLGISEHLDDADLQQFVNSKTNRPIDFAYIPVLLEGKRVALISIPQQERPTYLVKPYGGLLKDTVYIRRGTSTDIAKPTEVARMGKSSATINARAPILGAFIVSGVDDDAREKSCQLESVIISLPSDKELPDYGISAGRGLMFAGLGNKDFYRDWARWNAIRAYLVGIRFAVANTGDALADSVKIVFTVKDSPGLSVYAEHNLPSAPDPGGLYPNLRFDRLSRGAADIICKRLQSGWRCTIPIGKVTAKDTGVCADRLYFGATEPCELRISTETFSDSLPNPVVDELTITLSVKEQVTSTAEIINAAHEWMDR